MILAFQNNPEMICIDEITTGLDIQSRQSIIDFIKNEISHNKTLIMITHYIQEAEALCDKFIFMKGGKVVEWGDKKILMDKYQIMKTVDIETLSDIDFPSDIAYKKITEHYYRLYVTSESDMMMILNVINNNNTIIKKYNIVEPSLEQLYHKIIEGAV